MCFAEAEDSGDVFFRFVGGEEGWVGVVPGADDVFCLVFHIASVLSFLDQASVSGRTILSEGRSLLPRSRLV